MRKSRCFQAIVTRTRGVTNSRPMRVQAKCSARSISVPWDHALNPEDNHKAAAMELARKMCWDGEWHGGGLPEGNKDEFVFVLADGPVSAFTVPK